jgi:hypothetical protein
MIMYSTSELFAFSLQDYMRTMARELDNHGFKCV